MPRTVARLVEVVFIPQSLPVKSNSPLLSPAPIKPKGNTLSGSWWVYLVQLLVRLPLPICDLPSFLKLTIDITIVYSVLLLCDNSMSVLCNDQVRVGSLRIA